MPRSELAIGGSLASIEITDDAGGTEGTEGAGEHVPVHKL